MHHLEIVPTDAATYAAFLPSCHNWTLYHTPEWLSFVGSFSRGQTVLLAIRQNGQVIGVMPTRRLTYGPFRILASPFKGWNTPYMGPTWIDAPDAAEFTKAITAFALQHRIHHVEISSLDYELAAQDTWKTERSLTFMASLAPTREQLLAGFGKSCRKTIRRAERMGVRVEATDSEDFIQIYYSQLQQVFAKRNLKPTYTIAKVRRLWNFLKPSGRLLTSWAIVDGEVIATRIDMIGNRRLHSFGSASRQDRLDYLPNEILRFHVMAEAGAMGLTSYDMTGGGSYKSKFGGVETHIIRHVRSGRLLMLARNMAFRVLRGAKTGFGRSRGKNVQHAPDATQGDTQQ